MNINRTARRREYFRPRIRSDTTDPCSGFALVTVIWSLGLIASLALAAMAGARYRSATTASMASTERAASAAESAVSLGILRAMTSPDSASGLLLRCRLPSGERIELSIELETAKIDLNKARPELLVRLFAALSQDSRLAQSIVDRIVAYREKPLGNKAQTADQMPDAAGFTTILELDQIKGMQPRLFRAALPFITVNSGRSDPDPATVSAALRELLQLQKTGTAPSPALQSPASRSMTIRADIRTEDGARFVRLALVSVGLEDGTPYRLREWRHEDLEPVAQVNGQDEPTSQRSRHCFELEGSMSTLN